MNRLLFDLHAPFMPTGDQPEAIDKLVKGIQNGVQSQVLLGATGTGKTFTMAQIIAKTQKPTLIIAHNKTLTAQLCSEFQQFFPNNAVGYFVSYYDYYQPEAYLPRTDTYIEKETQINEEIDKFRHKATVDLLTRKDVILVASVSCIYGLGDVSTYEGLALRLTINTDYERRSFLQNLTNIQFERIKNDLKRGTFEVLGDVITIFPTNSDTAYQLEFFGDTLDKITEVDSFTGSKIRDMEEVLIFPAKHHTATKEQILEACKYIESDLQIRLKELESMGKTVEAYRLKQRTEYDLEMFREVGYVNGIENYIRYFMGNVSGKPPQTLLDYFPNDYLCFIDESHITVPQVGGMYNGNLSRKDTLIEYGFRLPSARDNRPLTFDEFESRLQQRIYVSATPGKYEYNTVSRDDFAEQVIRPTGLLDPIIELKSSEYQIDDVLQEIRSTVEKGDRILITTITKKSAEDLSEYLIEAGIKAKYLHSDIDTLERIQILTMLRKGILDVVVGINLLREGLDLPEVSLVAILDADKEGFLRSRDSLLQTIGRAARNENGRVIMYSRKITDAMKAAIDETNRRRDKQIAYNIQHNITPKTIKKAIIDIADDITKRDKRASSTKQMSLHDKEKRIKELEIQMDKATKAWEFELAAELRDAIFELKR